VAGLAFGVIIVFLGFMVFQLIWNAALIFAIPLVVENDIGVTEAIKLRLSAVLAIWEALFC
jgi:membrane-anchored glycerophosphoryl diester phosphodiesterase (GDPDase)